MAIALEIYEALRSVGVEDAKAKSTAEKFDQAVENGLAREMEHLATREDLAREVGHIREDMAKLESKLVRWMFIFWVGQFASIVGVLTAILFAFFKP